MTLGADTAKFGEARGFYPASFAGSFRWTSTVRFWRDSVKTSFESEIRLEDRQLQTPSESATGACWRPSPTCRLRSRWWCKSDIPGIPAHRQSFRGLRRARPCRGLGGKERPKSSASHVISPSGLASWAREIPLWRGQAPSARSGAGRTCASRSSGCSRTLKRGSAVSVPRLKLQRPGGVGD